MIKRPLRLLGYLVMVIFVSVQSCTCSKTEKPFKAIRSDEFQNDESKQHRYVLNEIIVTYKGTPGPEQVKRIKALVADAGIDTSALTIRKCNSCSSYIELWHADNIHSVIHGETIRGGTVSGGSKGVGEDSLAQYSLNFLQHLPVEQLPSRREYKPGQGENPIPGSGRDTVLIAVLDTGIDTLGIVPPQYAWTNRKEKQSAGDDDNNCYVNDVAGWNFIGNNDNITDDNINLHGTLVSQYIVNEFKTSPNNFVQIMTLKTHDHTGYGDLFSTICAIHYAVDKGANIINASWGFYFYEDGSHPYLDSLITIGLKQKGILFVTASGNKIDEVDAYAKKIYQDTHGTTIADSLLRNLEIHNFYPAYLSERNNNVIVATTTDGTRISPTQNYSSKYVDLGVMADSVNTTSMKFLLPFATTPLYISGSSFATAIATGKIGAHLDKSLLTADLDKQPLLENLSVGAAPVITQEAILDSQHRIHKGRVTKRD